MTHLGVLSFSLADVSTYLNGSINDPLFDGVFFDCSCGHPKNGSAGGDAAYAAGYEAAFGKANAALAAKQRWGTAWAGGAMIDPAPNPGVRGSDCKDVLPRVIETGQLNGTSQFSWAGDSQRADSRIKYAADNFTLYIAGFLLGRGESSTLTAHVTGGYDASIRDESGFFNNSALLRVDYGEPLGLAYCVGGVDDGGRHCPSLRWERKMSRSDVAIQCDNATGAATAWITHHE